MTGCLRGYDLRRLGVAGSKHPQCLLGCVQDQADSHRLHPVHVPQHHSCLPSLNFQHPFCSESPEYAFRTQFTVFSRPPNVCCVVSGLPGRNPQGWLSQPQHEVPQQLGLCSQALVDGVNALPANTGHRVNAGSLSFPAAATELIATGIHLGSEAMTLIWIITLE